MLGLAPCCGVLSVVLNLVLATLAQFVCIVLPLKLVLFFCTETLATIRTLAIESSE